MPLSIDLHVKYPFYKKWYKKKTPIFFSWNFHIVFREQIAIFYQIFKSGSSKQFFKCPLFTKVSSIQNCFVDSNGLAVTEIQNLHLWIFLKKQNKGKTEKQNKTNQNKKQKQKQKTKFWK